MKGGRLGGGGLRESARASGGCTIIAADRSFAAPLDAALRARRTQLDPFRKVCSRRRVGWVSAPAHVRWLVTD
jgi:hypothetical protein